MTEQIHVDAVISPKWIVPIHPRGQILEDCGIAVLDGEIVAVEPNDRIEKSFVTKKHFHLPQHLVMPGLINAHGHAAMTLLRGLADDLPLMTWLQEYIWPAESQWVDESFVKDGTELAIAEMLKSGTTCFSDMYFFPEVAARIADQSGIRAQICFPVLDFPTAWARDADEYIHKGLKLLEKYLTHDTIKIAFGPHAPYTVSDEPLRQIATLSKQRNANIQIHLHETSHEVNESVKNFGVRPIERLENLGLLGPTTQCVHLTQLTDNDIEILRQSGASAIHCPESNMKLASGTCPVSSLIDAGIATGLGTDGAASNNDLDMFGEMFTAAMLAKLNDNNAASMDAWQTLHMATLGGAKALGLEQRVGSIEAGKKADVIAIQLNSINSYPCYNIPSTLVYNNRKLKVTHSWVNGKLLMENEELIHFNEAQLTSTAKKWQSKIQGEKQ